MAKILIYDLETSSLDADGGVCLCIGYKFLDDKKVSIISIADNPNWGRTPASLLDDRHVWEEFIKVYMQADMVIGYFSKGFDQPYMYSKLMKHGLEIPANVPHADLFYIVKPNFRLRRKSMDNVTDFLDLQNREVHKTPVSFKKWQLAFVGDYNALEDIIKHCRSDILLTEKLYYKIRPLIRTHPRVAGWLPCRNCGSTKLQRRGYALTTTKGKRIRIQCQNCLAWETRSEEHAKEIK